MGKGGKLYTLGLGERDTLDIKLGGGLPKSAIVLIEGEYGSGKSALAQRFSYGFCDVGYHVVYLTPELDLKAFLEQMDSLNYNAEDHLLDFKLLFLHVDIESGKGYVKRLMKAERMWNGDIIIMDAFDQILRNDERFETLIEQKQEEQIAHDLISFFRKAIASGKTVILLVDPTNLSREALSPFRSVADVYFELRMIDVGSQTRRLLNVKRFSGMGKQVGDSIGYSVRSGTGIVMEERGVV